MKTNRFWLIAFSIAMLAGCTDDTVSSGSCGNGEVDSNETCDDGNVVSGDGCSEKCRVEAGWTCDEKGCRREDSQSTCGDGVIEGSESCDDGNVVLGDGCSDRCEIEAGWKCPVEGAACEKLPVCGNGVIETGESCDDGNVVAGDGCSDRCEIEAGWKCPIEGIACSPASCGNGSVDEGETCDEGDDLNVEYGTSWGQCGKNCQEAHYCGDGLFDEVDRKNGEECDAGNSPNPSDYNGCSRDCKRVNTCGDGKITHEEQCDDGNTNDDDGCSSECKYAGNFACSTVDGKTVCVAIKCGNGVVDENETCDDGNRVAGDGCSAACLIEKGWKCSTGADGKSVCTTTCGNGVIDTDSGETCDDNNTVSGDGCSASCLVETGYICEGTVCVARACGDGIVAGNEECDDGNVESGDGCSKFCKREEGYNCPTPGKKCEPDKCGDGKVTGDETCDTGTADSTGCNHCQVVLGYKCDKPGEPCTMATCGDGKLEGAETCEEDSACCKGCQIQAACKCDAKGQNCVKGSCGNGTLEFGEQCDDGNLVAGDGCSPICEIESIYDCNEFGCRPTCGDGLVIDGVEECDDGNLINGDGCSSSCKREEGFTCEVKTSGTPEVLELPIVYHDFIRYSGHSAASGTDGYVSQALYDSLPSECKAGGAGASYRYLDPTYHYNLEVGRPSPDFLSYCPASHCEGAVMPSLGKDGTPDLAPAAGIHSPDGIEETTCRYLYTCPAVFKWWFKDVPGLNKRIEKKLRLTKIAGTTNDYRYDSNNSFWPLDNNDGYGFSGSDGSGNGEFTSNFQTYFKYKGGETLTFDGDDDVWVFFNGKLAVDVGGIHPKWEKTVKLTESEAASKYHMYPNGIYPLNMFHAERCRGGSSYKLTLSGFVSMGKSTCDAVCGDGLVRGNEECDVGGGHIADDVAEKAGCMNCRIKAYCGNGKVEPGEGCDTDEAWCEACKITTCGNHQLDEHEQCDPSAEASDKNDKAHCLPTCHLVGCGDGIVSDGEECDDGNKSDEDMCTSKCTEPRCGDGIVSPAIGEVCDDGVNDGSYGGCGIGCTYAPPKCGDGLVDTLNGEECDNGADNKGGYGECRPDCKFDIRCGDGIVQTEFGELCDPADPATQSGCSYSCQYVHY